MIDYNQILCDIKGNAIQSSIGEPLTLRDAVLTAIETNMENAKNLSPTEKYRRYQLALSLASGKDDIEFQSGEVVESFKTVCTGAFVSPVLEGRLLDALNGAEPMTPKNLHLFQQPGK